jgi:parallel beta-helix repeat protein
MATYYVSRLGSDSNSGTELKPWKSLDPARDKSRAGDVILIQDGTYPGGYVLDNFGGEPGNPITIKAINPGKVIFSGTGNYGINVEYQEYFIFEGLTFKRFSTCGLRLTHSNGSIVRNCSFYNCNYWGLFTSYCDRLLIEGNHASGSANEHGIYVSNGGDNPIIRNNVSHNNRAAGIQINADPAFIDPNEGSRGDGITSGAIVENNIIYNNGKDGTAALNFASIRNSWIKNNLLYNNLGSGISMWDDTCGIEWGCKDNFIVNNTVYIQKGKGKRALQLKNGSTGNTVQNNILIGGAAPAIEFDNDSSFTSDYNFLLSLSLPSVANNEDTDEYYNLDQWKSLGFDSNSITGNPLFVSSLIAPFDFHLQNNSPCIDKGVVQSEVKNDLLNNVRPVGNSWDLGCFEDY